MPTTLPDTPEFDAVRVGGELQSAPPLPLRVPGTLSPGMTVMRERLKTLRDVLGGIETLRAAAERYLPKLSGESQPDYDLRLALANFFNTPRRAVKAVAGLIAQNEPEIGEDGDAAGDIRTHWEAIDDRGNHGSVFLRRFVEDAASVGFAGILVDMPVSPTRSLNRADAQRLQLRPYWVPIKYEQIYDADWVMLGSRRVLVYLELHETAHRRDARVSGRVTVDRYRVYERTVTTEPGTDIVIEVGPPTVTVWEASQGSQPVVVSGATELKAKGGATLSAIPFATCIAGDLEDDADAWVVRSPIQDLIDLSITWYQVFAERRNLMNRVCTQQPWASGYTPELDGDGKPKPLQMGPSTLLVVSENGKVGFAAPSADGFEPTRIELQDLQERMGMVGIIRMFFNGQVGKTQEGERNEAAPQLGILAGVARSVQDPIEAAVGFHAEYLGVVAPSVRMRTQFDRLTADAQMIDVLTKLAAAPLSVQEAALALLEAWSALPNGFEVDALVDKLRALVPEVGAGTGSDTSVIGRMSAALAQASVAPATRTAPLLAAAA